MAASAADIDDDSYYDLDAEGDGPDIFATGNILHAFSEPEDDDDGQELTVHAAVAKERRPHANHAEWEKRPMPTTMPAFDATGCGPRMPHLSADSQQLDFFDLWFVPMRDMLVRETTSYAFFLRARNPHLATTDPFLPVANDEMDIFIAICIRMGVLRLPSDRWYWRDDDFGDRYIKRRMSRARFLQIKRCFSVANPDEAVNKADKLAKVRCVLDLFNNISACVYAPAQHISLDEAQIQCAHRNARISHRAEKHKPLSDYIKVYSINESGTCYCPQVLLDERNGRPVREIVLQLTSALARMNKAFVLYTDRFYTSVDTLRALAERGLYIVGTCRADRGIPTELQADAKKIEGRRVGVLHGQ